MPRTFKVEFFPEERIELGREIKHHPKLQELLEKHPANEVELRIAEVATYCGIVLHGDYLQSDLTELCGKLRDILRKKRAVIFSIN